MVTLKSLFSRIYMLYLYSTSNYLVKPLQCFWDRSICLTNAEKVIFLVCTSFLIMLGKLLSLYSSMKSLYKNEDIAVFFLESLHFQHQLTQFGLWKLLRSVAADIEDDYGYKISQGQQYVVGNFLDRTRSTRKGWLFKEESKKTSLKKAFCTLLLIFYIENGTIFNQQWLCGHISLCWTDWYGITDQFVKTS